MANISIYSRTTKQRTSDFLILILVHAQEKWQQTSVSEKQTDIFCKIIKYHSAQLHYLIDLLPLMTASVNISNLRVSLLPLIFLTHGAQQK